MKSKIIYFLCLAVLWVLKTQASDEVPNLSASASVVAAEEEPPLTIKEKHKFIDLFADQTSSPLTDCSWAKDAKVYGLINGCNGYQKNEADARQMIEEFALLGEQWAKKSKWDGLRHGCNGYQRSKTDARQMIEESVQLGNK